MSANKRKNLAVTEDGAPYNKRPRPDFSYSQEPSVDTAHLGHPGLDSRERVSQIPGVGRQEPSYEDYVAPGKRTTVFRAKGRDAEPSHNQRTNHDADVGQRSFLPIADCGASDSETEEALTYLRAVR